MKLRSQLEKEQADRAQVEAQLQAKLDRTREELTKLKENAPPAAEQNPAAAIDLPEPADLLNQLKAKRKKSTASLADLETILEILEGS